MLFTELVNRIINKTISLEELENVKISYSRYDNLSIKEFIKEYQSYSNKPDKILELLEGLDNLGWNFDSELFLDHLANGLYDDVTLWYIQKFPADTYNINNKFLVNAALSIEASKSYGFPLKTLLANGFDPNVKGIDWFFFRGNYEGGCESSYQCYFILLQNGYKFSNPLVFYSLFSSISYNIEPNLPFRPKKNKYIPIDFVKLFDFPEVCKWFETNPIIITDEHIENLIELDYFYSREDIIENLINEIGFIKNKFIKWPNVIINISNYTPDNMDRTQLNICKFPLIGLSDNLVQEEFLL